jgi:hypothetical protein
VLRHSPAALVALLFFAGGLLAADKELTAKIVKVDVKKKVVTVSTDDGKKDYDVNDDTKFIGPKGGVSDKGINDDRLVPGTEVRLVIAGNNRTLREVHLPERKSKQ